MRRGRVPTRGIGLSVPGLGTKVCALRLFLRRLTRHPAHVFGLQVVRQQRGVVVTLHHVQDVALQIFSRHEPRGVFATP